MVQVSQERNDEAAVEFWRYVLSILHKFQHDGMSDEEDAYQDVTTGGVTIKEQVKEVMILGFRNPYFRPLFEMVDQIKGLESMVFRDAGKAPMRRVRSSRISHRDPPKNLPKNFLNPKYVQALAPFRQELLKLKAEFELRPFNAAYIQQIEE